jgi:hypothetical protein
MKKNTHDIQEKRNCSNELSQLDQKLSPFGFKVNDKGEITVIGERDGKEYKIGRVSNNYE